MVWELKALDGGELLTTLYPGSMSESTQEAHHLVRKLTMIP